MNESKTETKKQKRAVEAYAIAVYGMTTAQKVEDFFQRHLNWYGIDERMFSSGRIGLN